MSGIHFTLTTHAMALPTLDMIACRRARERSGDGRAIDPCQRSPA